MRILLTIEIGEQLEGVLPADHEGLIDCKGAVSLLLQSGEEQVLFFCWTIRLKAHELRNEMERTLSRVLEAEAHAELVVVIL